MKTSAAWPMQLALSVTMLLPLVSLGQDQHQSEIEEVIVIGQLSKSAVEHQTIEVEDEIYRLFNAANGNNRFNIECRRETPTGTHFPTRVCEPRFLTRARQNNNRDFAAGLSSLLTAEELRGSLAKEFEELSSIYTRLIRENPEFAEVMSILVALQSRLAQLQAN